MDIYEYLAESSLRKCFLPQLGPLTAGKRGGLGPDSPLSDLIKDAEASCVHLSSLHMLGTYFDLVGFSGQKQA